MGGNGVKDIAQLIAQRERILRILRAEIDKLPGKDPRRLIIWGLSQGAGIAVDVALHADVVVGGVIGLRGMALRDGLHDVVARSAESRTLDIFGFNGGRDWLCPPEDAKASYESLRKLSSANVCVSFDSEPTLAHGCARGKQRMS